jgi:hypothetical protein
MQSISVKEILMRLVAGSLFIAALLIGLTSTSAFAQLVRWDYIAGIVPSGTSVGGVPEFNVPWSVRTGNASINLLSGQLRFTVQGLVLGGAPPIGTPGPVEEVTGTLVCDINPADTNGFVLVDTPPVTLSPQGDAAFVGTVLLAPVCAQKPQDMAFLIRDAQTGRWIAYGAARVP